MTRTEKERRKSLSEEELRLEEYLKDFHCGRDRAIKSRDLETVFGCTSRALQIMVHNLRCAFVPVCSESVGYFYPSCVEEIEATMKGLKSRVKEINEAKVGMDCAFKRFVGM